MVTYVERIEIMNSVRMLETKEERQFKIYYLILFSYVKHMPERRMSTYSHKSTLNFTKKTFPY